MARFRAGTLVRLSGWWRLSPEESAQVRQAGDQPVPLGELDSSVNGFRQGRAERSVGEALLELLIGAALASLVIRIIDEFAQMIFSRGIWVLLLVAVFSSRSTCSRIDNHCGF